jgi:citrate lyase subunit alpha/citrate CoA-transferase
MVAGDIRARYALGGITAAMVQLHEEGYIEKLMDVQDFDLEAARSLARNPHHYEVDGNQYANL